MPKPPPPVVIPPLPKRPTLVKTYKSDGGFKVSATEDAVVAGPFDVLIKCAYLVRFGDAFKEWSAYDFDLSKNHVEVVGAKEHEIEGNVIKVFGAGADLVVRVTGLDTNRDLDVRVRSTIAAETGAA